MDSHGAEILRAGIYFKYRGKTGKIAGRDRREEAIYKIKGGTQTVK
jgi:hypothetical protein